MSQAEAARRSDPHSALLLGEAALRIDPRAETRAALVQTVVTTQLTGSLTGHTADVGSVAFSPDGRTLATGSGDYTVILWDLSDPARPHRVGDALTGHTATVDSVTFSPDGRTLGAMLETCG
jgi:WD40 repeat protein